METANDELTEKIIGCAIAVHRGLGPGLLESACEACLIYELGREALEVKARVPVPLVCG